MVMTVITVHPPPPFHGFFAIRGLAIRFGRMTTTRAGVGSAARLFRVEPQANQMAFVPQETPDFSTDRRVVAVVAPAPTNAFAAPSGFQGF